MSWDLEEKQNYFLNLETMSNIKLLATFEDYYNSLNKSWQYLHKLLQDIKCKRLAMMNKDRAFFQYNREDLVYIISPHTSQLHTALIKVMIKSVRPVVFYMIVDLHNYLLMTLDGEILRELFEHEILKVANRGTSQENVQYLAQLKQVSNAGLKV